MKNFAIKFILITLMLMTTASSLRAAEKAASEPKKSAENSDKVNVDAIKEKYWAKGDEIEMGVVQNRTYTKARKFELGIFGGIISSDPFLDIKSGGASFGYHFNEYFGASIIGWKSFVSPSSALRTFETTRGATTNTNEPRAFYGAEGSASLIYGKLSFIGSAILHYDLHLLAGAGVTNTESGNYATGIIGIGQQLYIANAFSVRIDYRAMPYKESIREKVITNKLGTEVGTRMNWSNSVTFGLTYLFGGGSKK